MLRAQNVVKNNSKSRNLPIFCINPRRVYKSLCWSDTSIAGNFGASFPILFKSEGGSAHLKLEKKRKKMHLIKVQCCFSNSPIVAIAFFQANVSL